MQKMSSLVDLRNFINIIQVVRCKSDNSKSAGETDKSCDSVVLRQEIFEEGPHQHRTKTE